jgi:cell division protein FtsW (lipid II flippase)
VQLGGLLLAGILPSMVFVQPDFGTALVFLTAWFMIAWSAGLRLWQLALLLVAALPSSYYGWTHLLKPYQRDRLWLYQYKNGRTQARASSRLPKRSGNIGGGLHPIFKIG